MANGGTTGFLRTARARTCGVVGVATSMLATLVVAITPAAASGAPSVKSVPGLPSAALSKPNLQVPPGDFSNPPGLDDVGTKAPSRPSAFDPARSKVLDDLTTPTRKVWLNSDSTQTAEISAQPVRFKDAGGWHDIDLSLVPAADGTLGARASQSSAKLPAVADGAVAVGSPAGTVELRHPQAAQAPATAKGATASYKGAVSGADLAVTLTDDGFEEEVTVADATGPSSYVDQLTLPAGVSARQGGSGVELVDAAGTVVGLFGNGLAHDASAGAGAPTPVGVRLLSDAPGPGVARVEVSVASSWLADPARVFPAGRR